MNRLRTNVALLAGSTVFLLTVAVTAQADPPASLPNPPLNVNVANTPLPVTVTNQLSTPLSVTVTNPVSTVSINNTIPIPVEITGNTAGTPYRASSNCFGSAGLGTAICNADFGAGAVVPVGMRLIVKHVTAEGRLTPGAKFVRLVGTGGYFAPTFVGVCCTGSLLDTYAVNVGVLDFLEAGRKPSYQGLAEGGNINMDVTVTGYLVAQ
jgi:hypothetical protein